jgi:hypothetical protein
MSKKRMSRIISWWYIFYFDATVTILMNI